MYRTSRYEAFSEPKAFSLGGKKMWCVPVLDNEYLERMTTVLELYEVPVHPDIPVVCLDEKSVELHEDSRPSTTTRKGIRLKDYEYVRRGTANLFVMTEPKNGRHFVRVTRRRTRRDFAETLKYLESKYPKATTIYLVMDNLNTHNEKSLIQRYGEHKGRKLWARFTPIYTPKHGSWLNQAEILIQVISRCCLGKRRLGTLDNIKRQVRPFIARRNRQRWTIQWNFRKKDADEWVKSFLPEH